MSVEAGGSTALVDLVEGLLDALDKEAKALLADDPDAVAAAVVAKESVMAEVERVTAGLRGAKDRTEADAWFSSVESDPARRSLLRAVVERCAQRNLANGRLLTKLRERNGRRLDLLTRRPRQSAGYGAQGDARTLTDSRPLARA